MSKLRELMHERQVQGNPVRNGVIGVGMMGAGIVEVMRQMEGMEPSFVADVTTDRAKAALLRAGIDEKDIVVTDDPDVADRAIRANQYVASSKGEIAADIKSIEVVTESTGIPEVGAQIAWKTITAGKHIVMMNVETDVCIGPLLKRMTLAAGKVYTGACGDEPACTVELIDFARSLGLQVVAAGKGKNTPYHPDANVDNIVNYFPSLKKMDRANPRMICEFVDGSKTAIEMSAIANAAGLHPDLQELDPTGLGMRGPHCTRDNLHQIFAPVSEGGIIQGEAQDVIEYCYGVSPGVFCVVRGDYDTAKESFASFGGGGTYPLYRPYHLTSLETPLAAAKAALLHESSIAPLDRLSCEVVCVTKKDLQPGEVIDHIGGFCVRGYLRDYDKAKAEGLLPLGLAAGSVVKRPVKAGEFLTYDDVDLNPSSTIVTLRKLQDTLMK